MFSNLNWNSHINHTIKTCQSLLHTINCLKHAWWGADPRLLISIYEALIRSRLKYGCVILGDLSPQLLEKLNKIQFRAIRAALGYRMSTPTNVMLAEACEPPLHIRFKYLSKCFFSKACTYENHILLPSLEALCEDNPTLVGNWRTLLLSSYYRDIIKQVHLLESYKCAGCYSKSYESLCPSVNVTRKIDLREAPQSMALFSSCFEEELRNDVCLFTDGFKILCTKFTGFTVVSEDGSTSRSCRLWHGLSSFSLEAMVILEALNVCKDIPSPSFSIFSRFESHPFKSCIPVLSGKDSNLILLIRDAIKFLESANKRVKFIWIPGHVVIRSNELADCKAKDAIRTGADSQFGVPFRDFKNMWSREMYDGFCKWAVRS